MSQSEESKFINSITQGVQSIEDGKNWFKDLLPEKQFEILREISAYIQQAGARETDVPEAIEKAQVKETYTPCALLKNGRLKMQLVKVLNLPSAEYLKSFSILISLLSIADTRRRNNQCKDGCSHWWHQPLTKPNFKNKP
jgi:hypothetical protein